MSGIRRYRGIDRVLRHRVDPLVGADVAKGGRALVRLALNDLQTNQTHSAHPRHDDQYTEGTHVTLVAVEQTLEGKVAVVTGGSRGIGLGIAQSFVDTGAAVMLVSRKPDGLEAAAAELTRAAPGSDVAWFAGHVGREEDAEACMQATLERFGAVDILVNNAATNPYAGPTIGVDAGSTRQDLRGQPAGPAAVVAGGLEPLHARPRWRDHQHRRRAGPTRPRANSACTACSRRRWCI